MSVKTVGAVSGVEADVGSTSRALYTELLDSSGASIAKADGSSFSNGSTKGIVALGVNNRVLDAPRLLSTGSAFDGATPMFFDVAEGAAVNTQLWTQTLTSSQTMTQANSIITFNASALTTSGSGSLIRTTRQFVKPPRVALLFRTRAKMVHYQNAVMELGFGDAVAVTAIVNNGAFFRRRTDGSLVGVVSYNGTETETDPLSVPVANAYYIFEINVFDDRVRFLCYAPGADPIINETLYLPWGAGVGGEIFGPSHIPAFARTYNNTAPATAPVFAIGQVGVFAIDANLNIPFAHQQASMQRSILASPFTTFAQLANYSNSAAPSSATLSNTAAGYTTLGGQYQFAAVAGAETDYALFGYTNAAPYQLYVTGVHIATWNMGAAVATTPTLLSWALGAQSTAVSLATASPPMLRTTLGSQSFAVGAAIGANAPDIIRQFQTPIVVDPGRFLHVILKMPVGSATASQIIRGMVSFDGYFY